MRPADPRAHLLEYVQSLPTVRNGPSAVENLDSLGLLQVVLYLEDTYGIRLADHRIEAADLRSIEGLLSLIERYAA